MEKQQEIHSGKTGIIIVIIFKKLREAQKLAQR